MTASVNGVILLLTDAVNGLVRGDWKQMNTDNFEKLSEEKQRAVINAGYTCFGRDGYKKTAISEIAEKAGISKASIFHYFGTKKELYHFLYDCASKAILEAITEGTEDFFECITLNMQGRLQVMEQNPGLYDFLFSLVTEENSELIAELVAVNQAEVERKKALLFSKVDWERFKPEYSRIVIMNLVHWVTEGCVRRYANEEKMSGEQIAAEEEVYLNILKRALYKEEYL